jgi:uncharacterized membrane protein
MSKTRLEAFSDGVLAVVITIMVLELKVPHGSDWDALRPMLPYVLTYLMSFVFIGIYWSNHHHMLHATERINGAILWANLHLLFWLSLTPVTTEWMSDSGFMELPTAVYGIVLLLSGVAYTILERTIIAHHGKESRLAAAVGKDVKAMASTALYLTAIPVAFAKPGVAVAIYASVAAMWLIPDRRIERAL